MIDEVKNMSNKQAIETQGILYTIADYCERNNHIKFWCQKNGLEHKIYVGSESEFTCQKNLKNTFEEIFEITKNNISAKCENINIFNPYSTKIQPSPQFPKKFSKEYNEIYAEVFWNSQKQTTTFFAEQFLIRDLNFGLLLQYKKYQDVFSDLNSLPEKIHKDWCNFLTSIPSDKYQKLWKNIELLNEFHNTLNNIKADNSQIKPHLFLTNSIKPLLESIKIANDSKVKISYMLADLLPKNLIKKYTDDFPLIESLLNKKNKEDFFKQNDKEIIEKLVIIKDEVYQYFHREYLSANNHLNYIDKFFNIINENKKLKENGLLSTDLVKDENINFYMTLKNNDIINKNFIKKLFIETITLFIDHPEMAEQKVGSLLVLNTDILSLIIDRNIDKLILENELKSNVSKTKIKRKI